MQSFLEILGVFLLSSVKFGIGGVPAAVFANFPFFKAMLVTISGGIAGVVFFVYLSGWLDARLRRNAKKKVRKKFTLTNKMVVYVKKYFGLIGLSIITPLFLSIPLGAFLAVRYYHDKGKVIRYMSVSIILWAVALFWIYHSFRNLLL